MIPDRKQQLFNLTSLREARRLAKTPQSSSQASPIKLKSLKDARDQVKRARPDSTLRLSESFTKIDLINEELRKRSNFSLSPTAISDQLERSPLPDSHDSGNEEIKEGSPAPVFEGVKPELPEISEIVLKEEEESEVKKEEIKLEKRLSDRNVKTKGLTVVKKPIFRLGRGMVKKKNEDLLEFMEQPNVKKKLTKSQERGLLDRLQGFSTKFLAGNK